MSEKDKVSNTDLISICNYDQLRKFALHQIIARGPEHFYEVQITLVPLNESKQDILLKE